MKRQCKSILLVLLTAVMCFGFLGQTANAEVNFQNQSQLFSSSDSGVKFEVVVPWKSLHQEIIKVDDQSFTSINLPEWSNTSLEGAPALPFMTKAIGVPFGADISVKVVPGKMHTFELSEPVLPVPTQEINMDTVGLELDTIPYSHRVTPNPEIYRSDEAYPGKLAEITNDGVVRQQRVAGIGIYPVQYHPQSNTLIIYESFQVEVVFEGTQEITKGEARAESEVYEAIFQSTLMNYEEARSWRVVPDRATQFGNSNGSLEVFSDLRALPWQPPEPGWRVSVREDGLYKLTYAELQLAGLPVDLLDPQTFQIFYLGTEIAIQVIGEDDLSFNEEDVIIFYGQGMSNKYTKDNVYWLTYGNTPGLRMDIRDGTPIGNAIPPYYSASLELEENHYYRSILPGEDNLERFYWDMIQTSITPTWSHGFYIEEPSTGAGTIQIALFGSLQVPTVFPDHHAIISINGTQIADVEWDGLTWAGDGFVEAEIPPEVLVSGLNTLTVFLPNDTGYPIDFIFVDWAKINYQNTFSANTGEDALAFSYDISGTWKFQLSGFSSDALDVYDVSNPWEVVAFDRDTLIIENTGTDFSVAFEDEVITEKDFLVATETTVQTILHDEIVEDVSSDLQSNSHQADYILITHQAFSGAAETLTDYRASQGLGTILVDVQDIYDEFGYGVISPEAIREFLAYTTLNWQAPAPSFVVLVGDGNYDPKNYLGKNKTSYIPPFLAMVDPWKGETAADNRYVNFGGPGSLPEMILGRLSVNNITEANNFVAKIMSYEQTPVDGEWTKQVLAVAGAADDAGDFADYTDRLIADTLPEPYQAERVYYGVTHTDIVEAVAALKAGINNGKLIVNFIGHGFPRGWSAQKNPANTFLIDNDISGFTNEGKYPIFLAMTCNEGYFIDPAVEAFGEVVARAPNKGAIASWSPTGEGVAGGHDYMNRGFFKAVFQDGADVLGEAVMSGLTQLWFSGSSPYLLETYELFGDPALVINRTPAAVNDYYGTAEDYKLVVGAEDGVLNNDFGFTRGNVLTASLASDVSNGVLEFNTDGSFVYTPNLDWFGIDGFSYDMYDGTTLVGTAQVTVTVHSINDTPVAFPQLIVTELNTTVSIGLTGSDADGDVLIYSIRTDPSHGVLDGDPPILTYTPNPGYSGLDSFTFVVNDGFDYSNSATITIHVNPDGYTIFLPMIVK